MSMTPGVKFKLGVTIIEKKELIKGKPVTYEEFIHMFNEMLQYVLDEIYIDLAIFIRTKVPKRTGQLQDTLLKTVRSSKVVGTFLFLKLGTLVPYAEYVAEMSGPKVKHFGEEGLAYYYGHRGKIILNDPFAIGNFWDELMLYTQERLMNILQRAIDEYFTGTGTLMRGIRSRISMSKK